MNHRLKGLNEALHDPFFQLEVCKSLHPIYGRIFTDYKLTEHHLEISSSNETYPSKVTFYVDSYNNGSDGSRTFVTIIGDVITTRLSSSVVGKNVIINSIEEVFIRYNRNKRLNKILDV